jgi:L-methionine (R)-S-oxide reductase
MLSERIIPEKSGYKQLADQAGELLTGVWFTDLANISALLFETLPDVNWVGFYLMHQGRLQLGPFQGRVACTHIPLGRGVCGEAAARRETLVVPDVHRFSDHITCDSRSRSEIVIPLISNGALLGVLDVDSPSLARFTQEDAYGLQELVGILTNRLGKELIAHQKIYV